MPNDTDIFETLRQELRRGSLILAVLGNLLNLKGVSPFVQMVLQGAIIVTAVVVSELRQRRR